MNLKSYKFNKFGIIGNGYYDISYTYEREEGRVINGQHFNVKLM